MGKFFDWMKKAPPRRTALFFPGADPPSTPRFSFYSIVSPGAFSVCVVDERWALDAGFQDVSRQVISKIRISLALVGLVRHQ